MRELDLDCGIAYERIATWLASELALPKSGPAWVFEHASRSCTVELCELEPRMLRTLSLERCRLIARGDDAAVEEFERLFTLRFVSAGG